MKAVILAGGFGTRITEETHLKPKPLVEIGGMPILWHIMKSYSSHGINDFVICLGYKGYLIKEYFSNNSLHMSDVTIDMKSNNIEIHKKKFDPGKITLVDTGLNTMTGGRLKRVKQYVEDEKFCFTYGDGVSDVNITKLIMFHEMKKLKATITAVQPPGRFGMLKIDEDNTTSFIEKPAGDGNWINGGYFVLEPEIFDYIKDDSTIWEKEPLERLSKDKQLSAYKHEGFWQPLDTLREKNQLEELWNLNKALWKTWQ